MQYRRFEDLPAWQTAINLAVETFEFTKTGALRGHGGLRTQFTHVNDLAATVYDAVGVGFPSVVDGVQPAQGRVVCHQLGVAIVRVGRGRYRAAYDRKKAQYLARARWGPACPD